MAQIPDLVAFVGGLRNGEVYDETDIRELVDNFQTYAGYWKPFVSVQHEAGAWKDLSFGDVVKAELGWVKPGLGGRWVRVASRTPGAKPALIVTLGDVPDEVAQLWNTRRLRAVSVEFFDHTCPFVGPDDVPVLTNVLKSVSLLGAQSEACKGMPRPVATFADRVGRNSTGRQPKRFGAYPMDRQAALQALQAAGMDVSGVTDAVPDSVLQAFLTLIQGLAHPDADNIASFYDQMPDDDKKKAFGDAMSKKFRAGGSNVLDLITGGPDKVADETPKPSDMPKLMQDAVQKALAPYQGVLATLQARAVDAKKAKIKAFRDEMTGVGQKQAFMTPVQFDSIAGLLEACDDATVKKFADGKAVGTVLDEQIATLKAAYSTPIKAFGDKAPAGGAGGSDDRARVMLNATPLGRAALALQAK